MNYIGQQCKNTPYINILVVVRHPVGGIRTFLRYVYTKFRLRKYKFIFLLPRTSELEALKKDFRNTNCEFVVIDEHYSIWIYMRALFHILLKEHIDIIHSHGFTSMVYSAIPAFIFKIPHIFTSHDVFTEKQFGGIKGIFKMATIRICFKLLDIIHSVSYDAQANLLKYFPGLRGNLSKLVVVQNGIEVERFLVSEREDWRKHLALDQQTFLIGFFGRFMAQKGFKFLVESIAIISRLNIIPMPQILAFGWGGFIREEQAVIRSKGLESFFHFLPFQENPAKAIRGLDVVVMPSLWEACPLLAMESLVAGVPLIGTNSIGLREVLQNTPAIIVPPKDSEALAKAIVRQIDNSVKDKFVNFRKEAAIRFDVKKQASALENIVIKLISK